MKNEIKTACDLSHPSPTVIRIRFKGSFWRNGSFSSATRGVATAFRKALWECQTAGRKKYKDTCPFSLDNTRQQRSAGGRLSPLTITRKDGSQHVWGDGLTRQLTCSWQGRTWGSPWSVNKSTVKDKDGFWQALGKKKKKALCLNIEPVIIQLLTRKDWWG